MDPSGIEPLTSCVQSRRSVSCGPMQKATEGRQRGPFSASVGMVGAGQLARMTQQAAIGLEIDLRVLAERDDEPAVLAGAAPVIGRPGDLDALRALAAVSDVVTFDHEQIPLEHLAALEAEGVRLAPRAAGKRLAQDKLHARQELSARGFPLPPFTLARTRDEAQRFADAHGGWPLIAKTPRGGYDGRGVFVLDSLQDAGRELATRPNGLILEPKLELTRELAALVAANQDGQIATYPVVQTVQEDGMCRAIIAPAPIDAGLAAEARRLAIDVTQTFALTGIIALELFQTPQGLLINELALRPHNSGHYTIEGTVTSQFEQHLRAVLDWPLGSPELTAPVVVTVNVVGGADGSDPAGRIAEALRIPRVHVHLYGKSARPRRKLGHVTVLGDDLAGTLDTAIQAAEVLSGAPIPEVIL
jgi:5-(carboxyamino)imidazole ribonucleotide synthase